MLPLYRLVHRKVSIHTEVPFIQSVLYHCVINLAVHTCTLYTGGYLHRGQQGAFPPQEVLFPPQ